MARRYGNQERQSANAPNGSEGRFRAALALDSGDENTAREEAEIARERALCEDGPPHSYKPALDEADRLLAQL